MKYPLFAFSFFIFLTMSLSAQSVREIIQKSDDLVRGKTSQAEITMTVIKPEWTREFSMKTWSLGTKYSLVYITSPAKDKGMVTLMREKEVWNYLPNIDKTIKIPPSMMLQSWMGSDFSNDDMVKQSSILEDYNHSLSGDSTLDGRLCWKITLIPKPEAAVIWGKVIMFIAKDGYFQLESQFFDEENVLVKKMKASDIKLLGNRRLPSRLEMIPMDKSGQKTVFVYHSVEFDKPIEPSFFSQQNMKRIK